MCPKLRAASSTNHSAPRSTARGPADRPDPSYGRGDRHRNGADRQRLGVSGRCRRVRARPSDAGVRGCGNDRAHHDRAAPGRCRGVRVRIPRLTRGLRGPGPTARVAAPVSTPRCSSPARKRPSRRRPHRQSHRPQSHDPFHAEAEAAGICAVLGVEQATTSRCICKLLDNHADRVRLRDCRFLLAHETSRRRDVVHYSLSSIASASRFCAETLALPCGAFRTCERPPGDTAAQHIVVALLEEAEEDLRAPLSMRVIRGVRPAVAEDRHRRVRGRAERRLSSCSA